MKLTNPLRLLPGLTLLAIIASPVHGQPPANCDCLWQGSFSQIVHRADLIISGQIISSKGNSADIRVDRTLYDKGLGFKEFKPEVRIWGNNGSLCRPEISHFPVGSEWLLALNKITAEVDGGFNPNTPNISYGRLNDYYLSSCGTYWLQLNEGMVSGNLVKGRRWQWDNATMSPVLLELIAAYVEEIIPEQALIEAAKPMTESKKLMEETKGFIHSQQ